MITGSTVAALELADHLLVITDLTIPSVRAARRFVDLVERLSIPSDRVQLIITDLVRGPVELKDVTRSLGKEPIITLPRDDAGASQAMNSGSPLNGGKPGGLSVAITALAAKLTGVQQPTQSRGLFRRIFAKEATS
jgi:pilus assembly protein CpaE